MKLKSTDQRPKPAAAKVIEGVGQDAPIVTLPGGGKQSDVPARLDLIDGPAIIALGRVLKEGAEKYPENNWRKIPTLSHLNKALIHIYSFISGDTQDDHLDHAFCRMMMAVATVSKREKESDLLIEWQPYEGSPYIHFGLVNGFHRYTIHERLMEVVLYAINDCDYLSKVDATFPGVEEAKVYAEMMEDERMIAVANTISNGPIEWKDIEENQLRGYVDSRHRYSLLVYENEVMLFESKEHGCFGKVDATFHSVEEAKDYAEMLEYERE